MIDEFVYHFHEGSPMSDSKKNDPFTNIEGGEIEIPGQKFICSINSSATLRFDIIFLLATAAADHSYDRLR